VTPCRWPVLRRDRQRGWLVTPHRGWRVQALARTCGSSLHLERCCDQSLRSGGHQRHRHPANIPGLRRWQAKPAPPKTPPPARTTSWFGGYAPAGQARNFGGGGGGGFGFHCLRGKNSRGLRGHPWPAPMVKPLMTHLVQKSTNRGPQQRNPPTTPTSNCDSGQPRSAHQLASFRPWNPARVRKAAQGWSGRPPQPSAPLLQRRPAANPRDRCGLASRAGSVARRQAALGSRVIEDNR